jgi:hypothetical protein
VNSLPIYIGYDECEDEAYRICRASLERRSSQPLHIVRLDQLSLRRSGWYHREWRHREGQRIDLLDGKPFSTDFTFTRFLVPALALHQGWALFCDCDFLFTADIAGLFAKADDRYAVMCVKHEQKPIETRKMGGIAQTSYWRKNWSSLVLWNCAHPAHAFLTPRLVNHATGAWLHAFRWLRDEEIGEVPATWNWLVGVSPALGENEVPCGIHFTLGVPTMPGCADMPYADLWRAERVSRRPRGAPLPTERLRAIA